MSRSSIIAGIGLCALALAGALLWLGFWPTEAGLPAPLSPRPASAPVVASGMPPMAEAYRLAVPEHPVADHSGSVRGRLIDAATGAPAVGIEVVGEQRFAADPAPCLEDLARSVPATAPVVLARARSGYDGRFQLAGLARTAALVLQIGRGTQLEQQRPVALPLPASRPLELGDILLTATARVRGRVLDGDGNPVAGAWVSAAPSAARGPLPPGVALLVPGPPAFIREPEATAPFDAGTTDCEGAFDLVRLAAGATQVSIGAGGFHEHLRQVSLHPGQQLDLGDLRLAALGTVAGRLHMPDGSPVAGAEVACASATRFARLGLAAGHPLLPAAPTDTDGRFCAHAPDGDPLLVAVRTAGAADWEVLGPMPRAAASDLALPGRASMRLQLRAASGPFEGRVQVTIERCADGGASLDPQASWPSFLAAQRLRERPAPGGPSPTDVSARLQAVPGQPGVWRLAELAPGHYRLRIESDGFAPTGAWIALVPGSEGDVQVLLQRAMERRFAVCGEGGEAVVGARLYWLPASDAAASRHPSPLPIAIGTSDGDGNVVCRRLGADAVSVLVLHPGHVPAVVPCAASSAEPARIVLRRCGRITGRVEAEDPTALAVLATAAGDAADGVLIAAVQQVPVDGDGHFSLEDLAPGRWELRVLARSGAPTEVAPLPGQEPTSLAQGVADVAAGGDTPIALAVLGKPPGASVHGTVSVHGAPAAGLRVRVCRVDSQSGNTTASPRGARQTRREELGQSALTDERGRFGFDGLAVGIHELTVADAGLAQRPLHRQRLRIDGEGSGLPCTVALALHEFTAVVLDPAGQPVAGLDLLLVGGTADRGAFRPNGLQFRARTDSVGGVVLPRLPAGTYEVSGQVEGLDLAVAATVVTMDGPLAQPLRAAPRR